MSILICRGFKDSKTAELMMQRAKKLKYNSVKKKKLGQLGVYGYGSLGFNRSSPTAIIGYFYWKRICTAKRQIYWWCLCYMVASHPNSLIFRLRGMWLLMQSWCMDAVKVIFLFNGDLWLLDHKKLKSHKLFSNIKFGKSKLVATAENL